ncbi:hypothetical protein [Aeromicrobium endophyticum]|uniref:Uncharacterized protein n=1 Tax=Aeromicrobium endophyticum TaxID=2292704 RepID=A0A371P368_9ACTN|nr:hypothetical protein [Aeromicrobium endophyticum]REK70389.1 hypothetical protein DX116_14700 [Aeromicrobium endophyticum]
MTLHAELVSGPIGPDTIRVPGDPAQLRNAVQGLRGLSRQVDQASHLLKQANPPDGERGRIVLALSRAAQRTGRTLDADSQQLDALADAIDHAADVLSSSIDGAEDVKRRWKQARDTLRDSVHGHKNAPPNIEALIHGIDSEAAESHLTQLKRQAGMTFLDGGAGQPREHAMLLEEGSPVDQAITAYRHAARGLVDEYAELVQKAKTADNPVDEKLPRHANVSISEVDTHDDGPDHHNVSGPGAVRSIGDQLQEGTRVLDQAENRLEDVRLAIRAGRMQPDDERVGSNDGFKRDWTDHFDKLRHTLNALRRAGDVAADRLRDADENGAADVRQALRDDD